MTEQAAAAGTAPVDFVGGGPVGLSSVVPQHHGFVDRAKPAALRLRIAKGLLPASFDDLLPTLAYLMHDPEAEVRAAAAETVGTYPADEVERVLRATTDVQLLDTVARRVKQGDAARHAALNKGAHNDTLVWLAGHGDTAICDIVGRNAERALLHPAIIEALFFNPKAPQGVVQNLLELAVREDLPLDHMPGYTEVRAALLGERGATDDEEVAPLDDIEFLSAMDMVVDYDNDQVAGGEAFDEQEETNRSLQAMIMNMSVAQKIRLALVGDANARKLLIRDPKKMVSLAVLKSPRLTEGEIRKFAANKTVADEVISHISRNRTWTRDYGVRKALVMNPKTPLSIAMGFMRSLTKKDIKSVSKSREVTGTIARAAKQTISKMEQAARRRKK